MVKSGSESWLTQHAEVIGVFLAAVTAFIAWLVNKSYDAPPHLLSSIRFCDGFIFMASVNALPTLYFDDSGTDAQSPIAIAAGYILHVSQLGPFDNDWREAEMVEGFKVFHMTDFGARQGEFKGPEWDDTNKRKRTLNRLIGIAKIRSRSCFSVAVQKSAYDQVILSDPVLAKICGRYHYTFAVHGCLDKVYQWRERFAKGNDLRYVFDRMSKGKGEIIEIFDAYRGHPSNAFGIVDGGFSFDSKEVVRQLQSADILAWHSLQHMQEHHLRGLPPRTEMRDLMGCPNYNGYYTRQPLQKLREGLLKTEAYQITKEELGKEPRQFRTAG